MVHAPFSYKYELCVADGALSLALGAPRELDDLTIRMVAFHEPGDHAWIDLSHDLDDAVIGLIVFCWLAQVYLKSVVALFEDDFLLGISVYVYLYEHRGFLI